MILRSMVVVSPALLTRSSPPTKEPYACVSDGPGCGRLNRQIS
jgi:hypothetical protein